MTFTESPPPLPSTPVAYFKCSHLDTENLFTVQAENNTVYFHFFFLQAFAESMTCDARASGAAPVPMCHPHGTMKEQFTSCQSSAVSPRRQSPTHSCFLLGSSNQR